MIAGQLQLFGMNGIFFKGMLHTSPRNFETQEIPLFEGAEGFDAPEDDLETRFYFTPIEVNGQTEYVTGSFSDAIKSSGDYRITIWLLVEESPIPADQNRKDNAHE